MYRDVNGKEGFTNLVGKSGKIYTNCRNVTHRELLRDGIVMMTAPLSEPITSVLSFEEQKNERIFSIKAHAKTLLFKTDWMVIRELELGTEIPESVKTYRAKVRQHCKELELMVTKCVDQNELNSVNPNWP